MKDSILNSVLIAATFTAVLYSAFSGSSPAPRSAITQVSRVLTMEKTVVAAKRLPPDLAVASPDDAAETSAER